MTEFAKEKSKLWAPVVMHKVHNAYGLPPDRQNTQFLRFFALFGAQKPNSGVEIFPKKKFFFLRFFDFLTRRWPVQSALVVQKMAGELTLDAQNSSIHAFFNFLVPEGCLGCSEQASKTLVKKNWDFFFFFDFSIFRQGAGPYKVHWWCRKWPGN